MCVGVGVGVFFILQTLLIVFKTTIALYSSDVFNRLVCVSGYNSEVKPEPLDDDKNFYHPNQLGIRCIV